MLKKIKILTLLAIICISQIHTFGQNSSSSPYSMFGVGDISNYGFGRNLGMGGVASPLLSSLHINPCNPASYAMLQQYSFIFEVGLSASKYRLKTPDGDYSKNDANIRYIAAGFYLTKWWKAGIGLRPVTDIGYNIEQNFMLPLDSNQIVNSYKGEGGINSFYFDNTFNIFKQFSVGIKGSYVFGTIDRINMVTSYNDLSTNTTSALNHKVFDALTFQLGAHFHQKLGEKVFFNLGATYGKKADLSADYEKLITSTTEKNRATYVDTIFNGKVQQGVLNLPSTFGIGTSVLIDQKLEIAADYQLERWSESKFFGEAQNFKDNKRLSFGLEYTPNYNGIKYFQLIRYRAGFNITDSYLVVNGNQLKQVGGSLGMGLPLKGGSEFNVAFTYTKRTNSGDNSISENYYQIHLNFSLSAPWFYRSKFE